MAGWLGGWVAVLIENKANSAFNKVEVEVKAEAELGKNEFGLAVFLQFIPLGIWDHMALTILISYACRM